MASTNDSLLQGEPTLDELFAEPIVQMITQRDGVEPTDIQSKMLNFLQLHQSLSMA